ncbi:hypothetical protein MC885_002241 [Smutsia gigantea]|nr:hypothetical protein MC885_002241 [Smutsia gigantea]
MRRLNGRLASAGGRQLRDSRDTQDPRVKREQGTSLTHFRGAETGRPWYPKAGKMVVTRSARPQASPRATSPENPQQENSAKRIRAHPKGRQETPSVDPSPAESGTTRKQSPMPRTPKTRNRKSTATGSLPEMNKPSTDGEITEAESNCSVSKLQDPILRITRRRQILVACTPVSTVRKRLKITPLKASHTEEVSEAASHVSGISRIVLPTVITARTTRRQAKSLKDPNQKSHVEADSDAESSCSDISFSSIATRRTTRSMQRKLQAQMKEKGTKIVPGNEKQIINTAMNSEDSGARQMSSRSQTRSLSKINQPNFCSDSDDFDDDSLHRNSGKPTVQKQHFNIREEKQASVTPLSEIKQNCKSLDEEAKVITDEGKEINEKNLQLKSLSELQDTSLQQLVSQRHSTPQNNKTISEPSNLNCEAIMKSLAQTFAVVEVDRWNEERKSTIKTNDLTELGDSDGSKEDCTDRGGSEDMHEERDKDFEYDTKLHKSEFNTSQNTGHSVLLVLSSDESQQSENSENEEDTVCFVENSGQKESLNGDSENTSCDNALFVIDTTPGLSTDKNFYLDEGDKASEVATEEENQEEEEDEQSEEELSDHDENKDEFSDEDDLLNTKSKLLKLTSSSIDPGLSIKQLGGLYINFNADKLQSSKRTLTQIKEKKTNEVSYMKFSVGFHRANQLHLAVISPWPLSLLFLQKTVVTPDFEKNFCVPPYSESKYQLQKKRRKERQKTAGDGWFGMKAPELTDELKNDLKALKMRASMDPKRFYKKNDRDGFPKYFQV